MLQVSSQRRAHVLWPASRSVSDDLVSLDTLLDQPVSHLTWGQQGPPYRAHMESRRDNSPTVFPSGLSPAPVLARATGLYPRPRELQKKLGSRCCIFLKFWPFHWLSCCELGFIPHRKDPVGLVVEKLTLVKHSNYGSHLLTAREPREDSLL